MVNSSNSKFRTASALGLASAALLLAGCGSSSSPKPSPPSASSHGRTASQLTISTHKGPMGTYLTGASGRALYLWAADSGGTSSCSGACAQVWTPLLASATPNAAGGVNAADLGTIVRASGSKQVTYNGHPLYYYAADPGAGTTHGQGSSSFGARWWLVAPSGAGITARTSGSGGSSSSGGSSGGYGGSSGGGSSSWS
jgi:predicted lipoprotein with Yx(FWY)xxD motif